MRRQTVSHLSGMSRPVDVDRSGAAEPRDLLLDLLNQEKGNKQESAVAIGGKIFNPMAGSGDELPLE